MPEIESLDLSASPRVAELLGVIMENVEALAALASNSNRDTVQLLNRQCI